MAKNNKEKLVQSAQAYVQKGQIKKAIGEFEKIIKEDPEDIRIRLKLADLYWRQKDHERAVQSFKDCGEHYQQQGFGQKAIAVYKQAIAVAPQRHDLYLELAKAYRTIGRDNDAAQVYHSALTAIGSSPDPVGRLSAVLEILEVDPNNISDRVLVAEGFVAHNHNAEAAKVYRLLVDLLDRLRTEEPGLNPDFQRIAERYLYFQPEDIEISKKLAASYVATDQPERALPKLKVAFRKSPHDQRTLRVVAEVFDQLGQTHKAITVYREMARLYGKSGLDADREECLRTILLLDPTDERAREELGETTSDVTGTTIEFDSMTAPVKPAAPPVPGRGPMVAPPPPDDDALVDDLIAQATGGAVDTVQATQPPLPQPSFPSTSPLQSPPQPPPMAAPQPPPVAAPQPPPQPFAAQPFAAPPPAASAPPAAPALDDGFGLDDLDFDDDDDELGFDEEDAAEQTLVDQLYIPQDVLNDVAAGITWGAPPTSPQEDQRIQEDVKELDFYVQTGLKEEATVLLHELLAKYGQHPELLRRQQTVDRMS